MQQLMFFLSYLPALWPSDEAVLQVLREWGQLVDRCLQSWVKRRGDEVAQMKHAGITVFPRYGVSSESCTFARAQHGTHFLTNASPFT